MRTRSITNVSTTIKKMYPTLSEIIEKEGKLRETRIGEDDLFILFNILEKDWISLGSVLFLSFNHGDWYPLSAIVEALGCPDWKILRRLGILKYKGLVKSEQLGIPIDFFGVDKVLLLSAINDYKLKRLVHSPPKQEGDTSLTYLFDSLHIHPKIRKVSESLFKSGHYSSCILEAFKCINVLVKEKSGINDKDGQTLMAHVFSESQPILKLNSLASQSEIDEQIGFRFIFMGAMTGIRNPKAHEIINQINPHRTLEYLMLASLLAQRIDESKK